MTQDNREGEGGSLLWAELTAPEVNARAKAGAVLILPIASIEQHGPHLATGVDTVLASAIALETAGHLERDGVPVIVAPCLWVGLAGHHMSLGGTFTLSPQTYHAVLCDLVRSAARHGFSRIALLNGHGGNIHASAVAAAALCEELDIAVVAATYWHAAAQEFASILTVQDEVLHACEAEASMMMHVAPALVRGDRLHDAVPPGGPVGLSDGRGLVHHRPFERLAPTGVLGDPRAATRETGAALIAAAATVLAARFSDDALWAR